MSAPLQWVLWGFFSTFACQESSLLERISLALAMCQGRELGVPGALPPQCEPCAGVTCCQIPASPGMPGCAAGILGFTALSSAASHTAATHREVSQPWAVASVTAPCQLWKHHAAPLHPVPGSDLPLPQAPPALTSAIPTASGSGFLAFVFLLSQR